MWRTEGVNGPMTVFLMRSQGTDADDRVVDMFREFVPHCGPNVSIGLAVMPIGGGKALQVRSRLNVPDDDAGAHNPSFNRVGLHESMSIRLIAFGTPTP